MRGLRAAGSIRANSPKLKNHRLSRWMFIVRRLRAVFCAFAGALYERGAGGKRENGGKGAIPLEIFAHLW